VLFADTAADAETLVRETPHIDQTVILSGVPQEIKASWVSSPHSDTLGRISVTTFTNNRVGLEAEVTRPGGAWLYYADSYHPGWRAFVNGKEVRIAEANLAFKAIRLEEGKNVVEFKFFGGLSGICSSLLAIFGFIFSASILWSAGQMLTQSNAAPS